MARNLPDIIALDFDGVLCDGLLEYFQTSWRTYCQIWQPNNPMPTDDLAAKFYRLRPVIETGWEMPVLIRALILDTPEEKILHEWLTIVQTLLESEQLEPGNLGRALDTVRDEWIQQDLSGWLELHRFYPGVIEQLRRILANVFIVTTKEGRFVQQLLQQQGIQLQPEKIIGKEIKRPKHQTLQQLIADSPGEDVRLWFVEDRLKTLQSVQQKPDLQSVRLYLADWGYNTAEQQAIARNDPTIKVLSLSEFVQDLSAWS